MSQVIDLSAGGIEYTWPTTLTEKNGKDISGAPVYLSLGTYAAPGAWLPPDTLSAPTISSRVAQLLIGDSYSPAVGHYWLWAKVSDSPEVVPRRGARITII